MSENRFNKMTHEEKCQVLTLVAREYAQRMLGCVPDELDGRVRIGLVLYVDEPDEEGERPCGFAGNDIDLKSAYSALEATANCILELIKGRQGPLMATDGEAIAQFPVELGKA